MSVCAAVDPMGIRSDEYNGVCVVAIDGDLAGDAVAEARGVVDGALSRRDGRGIVFDLGACNFVDSAALELLCRVRRRCDDAGTRVALARVGPACAKILELTRLAGQFDCHPDVARALGASR